MKTIRFLAVDPHWREYDEAKYPHSMALPSAGLAYVIASAKTASGTCVGVEHFFTEKKQRAKTLEDFSEQEDDFIRSIISKALAEKCHVVLLTTTTAPYHRVLRVIEKFSELPDIKLIIGGSGITVPNMYPRSRNLFFKRPWKNLITVSGEGEEPIREIFLRLLNGDTMHSIPGITFTESDQIVSYQPTVIKKLDTIPYGDYSDFDLSRFFPALLATHSRGCSGNCTFCDEKDVFAGLRFCSVGRAVGELTHFKERHGVNCFKWADSSFSASEKEVIAVCKAIANASLGVHWLAFSRVKEVLSFKDSTFELLRQAGCFGLHLGFETFERPVLERVRKGYSKKEEATLVTKMIRDHGIRVIGSFQLGFGATDETSIADSVDFGASLDLDTCNYHAAVPPVRQVEDPDDYGVSPTFRIWNNDPCVSYNLHAAYAKWHENQYGFRPTMGRHTPMREFMETGNIVPQPAAYQLSVSDEVVAKMLVKAMSTTREQSEYNLFKSEGFVKEVNLTTV